MQGFWFKIYQIIGKYHRSAGATPLREAPRFAGAAGPLAPAGAGTTPRANVPGLQRLPPRRGVREEE